MLDGRINYEFHTRLFRWSWDQLTASRLQRPWLVDADHDNRDHSGRLDTHDEAISSYEGFPGHRFCSSFRPGMGRQFASDVNRLLIHVEADLLTCTRTLEWRHNRRIIQDLAQRFFFDAGQNPVLLWAHRTSWDHATVLEGCYSTSTLTSFTTRRAIQDGAEPCTVFLDHKPLEVRLGVFAWEPVIGLDPQQDGYFRLTNSEIQHRGGRPVTNAVSETLGVGRPLDLMEAPGEVTLAPATSTISSRALWRDSSWRPKVLQLDESPPGDLTRVGYISADQSINLWRLYRGPQAVMNQTLGFQLHPETGRLMQLNARSGPFAVTHGEHFASTPMGRFAGSL